MQTAHPPIWPEVLGRFTWHDLPFVRAWENPTTSEIIGAGAASLVIIGFVVTVTLLTRYRAWGKLLEWVTSLDHKKIGIMYVVIALVMPVSFVFNKLWTFAAVRTGRPDLADPLFEEEILEVGPHP